MSQMDIAGSILAKEISRSRLVTVAVDSIQFIKPVHVGDVVGCYGKIMRIGNTSITINMEVWVKKIKPATSNPLLYKVTEAAFTYVAVDMNGKKQPITTSDSS